MMVDLAIVGYQNGRMQIRARELRNVAYPPILQYDEQRA